MTRRSVRRRVEIAALIEEGRQAFLAGRHRQTNPHRDMNAYHWLWGFDYAAIQAENAEPSDK